MFSSFIDGLVGFSFFFYSLAAIFGCIGGLLFLAFLAWLLFSRKGHDLRDWLFDDRE